MLDIGFLELMLIGVVGLLVLGPERLPRAARTAGMWIGKIKRTVSGMQREISAQLEAEELRQKLNEQQKKLDDSLKKAKLDVESIADTPPTSSSSQTNDSNETEQRVARASARLDDALHTIREDTPSAKVSSSATDQAVESEKEDLQVTQTLPKQTATNKDSNHQ